MNIIVAGSGNMGVAAAHYMLQYKDVSRLLLVDFVSKPLNKAKVKLSTLHPKKIILSQQLDFQNFLAACQLIQNYDLVIAAMPWSATLLAIKVAFAVRKPLMSITRPDYALVEEIDRQSKQAETLIMLGCGLEPGLTEILARHATEQFDCVEKLHIKCGGLPKYPVPPLNYKMSFGKKLPIDFRNAYCIEDGQLKVVPRFSGIESVYIENVGILEAWHDGLLPWLIELPKFKEVQYCTQKTLRWPGFASTVKMLEELGFLSEKWVSVGGTKVVPRNVVEAILKQKVRFKESDRDFTLLQIDAAGTRKNKKITYQIKLFDNFDETTKFSSMARTTSFTLGSVAHMVGNKEIVGKSLLRPENVVTQNKFKKLIDELVNAGMHFEFKSSG